MMGGLIAGKDAIHTRRRRHIISMVQRGPNQIRQDFPFDLFAGIERQRFEETFFRCSNVSLRQSFQTCLMLS